MGAVAFEGVGKVYADGTRAVSGMDLEIRDGEFMVLVGPSGCGKTTALRMVAGLESISEGVVRIGDRVVNQRARAGSRHRDGLPELRALPASHGLRQHRVRPASTEGAEGRDRHACARGGPHSRAQEFLERKPRALSGGQRQRVAMGRAIVRQPQAYLMDEPLSNLDAKLRVHMRAEIASLQNDLGVTTIYVTHDQVEAMTMGDRVAVMRKGDLQQVAPPQDLYERPVNLFVGGFIGSPAMNLAEATIERAQRTARGPAGRAHVSPWTTRFSRGRPALEAYVGRTVVVGIRPENLEDAALEPDTPDDQRLRGVVVLREPLGSEIVAHFTVAARPALTEDVRELARDVGQESAVRAAEAEGAGETVMVGRFGPRSRIKNGDVVDIAVETGALHFFDLETGLGIYAGYGKRQTGNGIH